MYRNYSEEYKTQMPEYGQLYRFVEKPDNKRKILETYMKPLNKTGYGIPKQNRYIAGKCCYIIKDHKNDLI